MKRTYLDSGVLIAAIRGVEPIAQKALEILDDPDREFVSSMFVKLEVLPKAVYHKQTIEQEFYTTFFNNVKVICWNDMFLIGTHDGIIDIHKSAPYPLTIAGKILTITSMYPMHNRCAARLCCCEDEYHQIVQSWSVLSKPYIKE